MHQWIMLTGCASVDASGLEGAVFGLANNEPWWTWFVTLPQSRQTKPSGASKKLLPRVLLLYLNDRVHSLMDKIIF